MSSFYPQHGPLYRCKPVCSYDNRIAWCNAKLPPQCCVAIDTRAECREIVSVVDHREWCGILPFQPGAVCHSSDDRIVDNQEVPTAQQFSVDVPHRPHVTDAIQLTIT